MIAVILAIQILAHLSAGIAVIGVCAVIAGAIAVRRFANRRKQALAARPPVTVLKPLCGDEPLLEAALASICRQTYPDFHIVFGVRDPADPALDAVRSLKARFPECDITVVVDPSLHGLNRKISNLINMLPKARHDILVFSDSDLHVAPDYIERIVAALQAPGAGLVTTVCLGLPTAESWAASLGATQISHCFVPGAVLARVMGREDCLGTTMALRRQTLADAGGLGALVGHLADDNVLGQCVTRLGLHVGLADTVPLTAVPSPTLRSLWLHELRWARTIANLEPALYASSAVQYPIAWALGACALTGGAPWAVGVFALSWATRAFAALATNRALGRTGRPVAPVPIWLLPLRDLLSVAEVVAGYLGSQVVWRGHAMLADDGRPTPGAPAL